MRTILEIIETAKNGQHIEKDEAYWTMLALDILLNDESTALAFLVQQVVNGKRSASSAIKVQRESFNRLATAAKMNPQELVEKLGRSPASADYQEKRKAMKDDLKAKMKAAGNGAGEQKAVDGAPSLN